MFFCCVSVGLFGFRCVFARTIGTDEQVADILTKPLGKVKFLTFHESLGIVERPYAEGPIGK